MTAIMRLFPVDNGDMTLLQLESGRFLLVDINIRSDADDPDGVDFMWMPFCSVTPTKTTAGA